MKPDAPTLPDDEPGPVAVQLLELDAADPPILLLHGWTPYEASPPGGHRGIVARLLAVRFAELVGPGDDAAHPLWSAPDAVGVDRVIFETIFSQSAIVIRDSVTGIADPT